MLSVKYSPEKRSLKKSLENYGYILIAPDLDTAIETANEIASEHMEIVTANPFEVMTKIKMQVLFSLVNTAVNHWVTILQDRTMFFLLTELQSSFLH